MHDSSIRTNPVPWLDTGGTTTHIFLILNHGHLADASHCRCISGMDFRVGGSIAIESGLSLRFNHRGCDRAAHVDGTLATLKTFANRGATLHIFCEGFNRFVISMTAADANRSLALLVSRIVDGHGVNRPQALLQ